MTALIKGLTPEVAKEVGKSAAIMLQQLIQWFKSKPVDKVYRTNDEMFEDLNGILSVATIQRCKQRLIDNGYVEITFDKGLNRTTHYKLTEKGQAVLDASKLRQEARVEKKPAQTTNVAKEQKQAAKPQQEARKAYVASKSNNALEHNSEMKASFAEGFTNKKAVPMPENIRDLLAKKIQKPVEEAKVVEVVKEVKAQEPALDLEWEAVIAAEMEMQDDYISDEDYEAAEIAMMQVIENAPRAEEPKMSFADLMKTAYSKATTEAQELLYSMKQEACYFQEDF